MFCDAGVAESTVMYCNSTARLYPVTHQPLTQQPEPKDKYDMSMLNGVINNKLCLIPTILMWEDALVCVIKKSNNTMYFLV
jgi:hypothetical protein